MILLLFIFTIDPRYHTFEEVAYELDSLAIQYPSITLLDTIGYSTNDSLPIFAMKISDNSEEEEDEPAILYVACHHAEEILGIEICMYMINDLLSKYNNDSTITHWVNNREIWFVPLLNPEGHGIVMAGIDTIWRKNKRDNNNNGFFDLNYDGVDPNRNYDFHWTEGGSTEPPSEYYRGPAPFSENETKAVRDLCLSEHFVFCITYHSARTGAHEVVYFPYRWSGGYSPDFPFIREIADSVAKFIVDDAGTGHYNALVGIGLDGRARNWLYGVCGTFTYCIEVSTTCIQPGWMVDDICERNLVGAYYLLDRVNNKGITGQIYDSRTAEPISAELIIEGYHDPELPVRQSDPIFGRFLRILTPGVYKIEIRKPGYASKYLDSIIVVEETLTQFNIYLEKISYEYTKENDGDRILIKPNPASNAVIIQLDNPSNFTSLKIYDVIGRLLKEFDNPTNNLFWQCNDDRNRKISNGIYWIIGKTTEERLINKVVVFN